MASEPKRGCGYRKIGGTYLVGGGIGIPCDRLAGITPVFFEDTDTDHQGSLWDKSAA